MNVEQWPIDSVIPYARNPRKNENAVLKVAASIKEYGWRQPIVVDAEGVVIAGHTRLLAAKHLKLETVPVHVASDMNPIQAKAYRLADNRVAQEAEWDDELLALEIEELGELGLSDLDALGFEDDELANLRVSDVEEAEGLTDPDEVPEPPEEPTTKPGDLWQLGRHRLLCGDSTKAEDVERLMAGSKADLCFTSPPYALGKSVALSGNKAMAAKANPYNDHEDNADEWGHLMREWFSASNAAVSDGWVVNVQPLAGNKRDLIRFIADNAGRLVDVATWDKGHAAPQMAAGVMASRFEWMIIFSVNDGASRAVPLSSWRGTVQSLYAAPPQRNNEFSEVHAATMPLHVPVWVMRTLCDQSQSVYEPFCGTGTTLIAAEQLGRKCYGMEISPQYCDVIVKRWEDFTGQKAVLANG